jgi:hypothetical protein
MTNRAKIEQMIVILEDYTKTLASIEYDKKLQMSKVFMKAVRGTLESEYQAGTETPKHETPQEEYTHNLDSVANALVYRIEALLEVPITKEPDETSTI